MFLVNVVLGLLALDSITGIVAAPVKARAPDVESFAVYDPYVNYSDYGHYSEKIRRTMNGGMPRINRAVEKRDGYGEYSPYGHYGKYTGGYPEPNKRAVAEKRDGYGEYSPYGHYGEYTGGYPEPNKRAVADKRAPEPEPVAEAAPESADAEKASGYGSYSPYGSYQNYIPPSYNDYGEYTNYLKEKRAPEAVAEPAVESAVE